MPELWVVWSFEHQAWWGPARFGYVSDLTLAGRYSKAEALDIERKANRYLPQGRNEQAMPLTDAEAYGPPV